MKFLPDQNFSFGVVGEARGFWTAQIGFQI